VEDEGTPLSRLFADAGMRATDDLSITLLRAPRAAERRSTGC
jgi:hypothetical protein